MVGVRAGNDTLGKEEVFGYLSTRTGTVVATAAFHDRKPQLALLKGLYREIFQPAFIHYSTPFRWPIGLKGVE